MKNFVENITIEDARIIFRNFSGTGSKFNREGQRNFCVVLEDQDAVNELKAIGWGIKELKPRSEDEDPTYYIKVNVSYEYTPPVVYIVVGDKKTPIGEDAIGSIDHLEIKQADVVIRPYQWNVNGKEGVAAYLKTLYIVVAQDTVSEKYADLEATAELPF